MERISSNLRKVVALLTGIVATLILLPFALAEDNPRMGEDYYGNDINAAILEADQNKRTVNYTNKYWYNRTTSKSFELPNMAKDELEKENLPGALGATAAGGEINTTSLDLAESEQVSIIQKNNTDSQQQQRSQSTNTPSAGVNVVIEQESIPVANISYTFPRGDMVTTQDIRSSTILISTPRP